MKQILVILLTTITTQVLAADNPISAFGGLPFLIIMFALMYFLLIRPQQKKAKEHKAMLSILKKGDEVVTNGGVLGKIKIIDDNFVSLQIAENTIIKVQRQAINQKMPKGSFKTNN